ncbi:MAG TPA: hypothetical protein VMF52_10870, partial [Steroidobacteraceae bacterium]|nr:hypothetical protein [Steroidobacteraceae bacterium]
STYGYYLAIDGDSLLTGARRYTSTDGTQVEGVYLFQRNAGGTWTYVKPLMEGQTGYPLVNGDLAAIQVANGVVLVFERGAQGWTQTATITLTVPNSLAFRIDDGAIYVEPRNAWNDPSCAPPYQQWRKVSGTWQQVASIGQPRCNGSNSPIIADVNDARALYLRVPTASDTQSPAADIYAENTPAWSIVGTLPATRVGSVWVNGLGPRGGLSGNLAYLDPGFVFRKSSGDQWTASGRLYEPESELDIQSLYGTVRGSSIFVRGGEADYEIPNHDEDYPSNWATLRVYRPRADGTLEYYAKLNSDFDVLGWAFSEDGARAATISGPDNYGISEPTLLYVFEIPQTAAFAGTQQDDFEQGNLAKWTATLGQFSVAQTSASTVMRQSGTAGDAKAYVTGIDWTDQAIEADLRPTAFNGADRWFGLAVRRIDDQNYYYATFRQNGRISLRRYRNGVVTELAYELAGAPFVPGHSYRVRLEAVGDQLAVFLNGFPVTHAKDSTFTHGHPGVVSYRASFDADNVIVSSGTRLLVRFDSYKRRWNGGWYGLTPGNWQLVTEPSEDVNEHGEYQSYVLRQGDTSGDAKWFSKVAIGNQVVSARVRSMAYGTTTGTNDAWFGIAAHVIDDRNYYYVTLRRRNELSLRRMVNGQVQVIATVPQGVTPNNWYDLRLEIIGKDIRAYVDGELRISTKDPTMTGGGRSGLLMYKTAADWYHFISYQP